MAVGLALVALLALAIATRASEGRLLTPAATFAAYWSAAALAPVLLTDLPILPRGVWYIAAAVAAFSVGSMSSTGMGGSTYQRPGRHLVVRRTGLLRVITWAGAFAGIASALAVLRSRGTPLGRLATLQGIFESGNETATALFGGAEQAGLAVAMLLAVTYAASAVAPFASHGLRRRWQRALYVALPTLGAIFHGIVTTKRLGFLVTASITAAAMLMYLTLRDGQVPKLTLGRSARTLVAISMVAVMFAALAFVRVGTADDSVRPVILDKLEVYAFGYLPAFTGWYEDHWRQEEVGVTVGASTVSGVTGFVNPGRGSQAMEFREIVEFGQRTNIFTMFRYLIEDFGTAGSLVVLYLLGFAAARALVATKRGSTRAAAVLGLWISVVPLAAVQPIYIFANVTGGVLVGWFVVTRNVRVQDSQDRDVCPVSGNA